MFDPRDLIRDHDTRLAGRVYDPRENAQAARRMRKGDTGGNTTRKPERAQLRGPLGAGACRGGNVSQRFVPRFGRCAF